MNIIRRLGSGDQEPEVAGTYLVLTIVLHLFGLVNTPWVPVRGFEWIVLLLVGLGAIMLRRRWLLPSSALLLLAGIGLLAVGSIGGYFLIFECVFGLFLLGSTRVRTVAFTLLCLVSIGLGVATWLTVQESQAVVLALFMAGFILFTPMLWAENVRTAKELAHAEAQRAQALESAASAREQRLMAEHHTARIEERTELAREMHDVLSARFSSIALLSGALLPTVRTPVREPLQSIRDESVSGLEEMAAMVRMLHSGGSALQARIEDLPALVSSFGSSVHWEYQVPHPERFSPAVHTAAHRTVSELLVNHAKHASGALTLRVLQDSGLEIRSSNALGDSNAPGAGTGLENIRTRVAALGGRCQIESGENFIVQIYFPEQP